MNNKKKEIKSKKIINSTNNCYGTHFMFFLTQYTFLYSFSFATVRFITKIYLIIELLNEKNLKYLLI